MNSPRNTEQHDLNSMEGKLTFLQKLPFFRDKPLEMLRLYAYLSKKEQYYAQEPIVSQGEPADRLFLVISGKIAICETRKDREFNLQILSEEGLNYFGELSLLTEFDWFFSARAIDNVTLLSITREAFTKVMEKFPEYFAETVAKIVQLRIERFIDQTEYLLDNLKEEAWRECGPLK